MTKPDFTARVESYRSDGGMLEDHLERWWEEDRARLFAALREAPEGLLFALHKTGIAPLDLMRVICRAAAKWLESNS